MCPLDLEVELCSLVPVRQSDGHASPPHACHNECALGSLVKCHVYSEVWANLISVQCQAQGCAVSPATIRLEMLLVRLSQFPFPASQI